MCVRRFQPRSTSNISAFQGLQPGVLFGGRYEIMGVLGQGGMGAVYKARDRELDRLIALKVIRPELATDPAILQRFKQELILSRNITHKNVVRIFDLGEAEGIRFISMEYVDGEDLRTILRREGKFQPKEAITVVEQVCRALDSAHSEGVIHRDLKPQNIMRDKHGRIVVMDFGLARSLGDSGIDPDRRHRRHAGIHVARAGDGQHARPALRHFQRRPDLLRVADRKGSLSRPTPRSPA
jgi:serine/threonine protein kinase